MSVWWPLLLVPQMMSLLQQIHRPAVEYWYILGSLSTQALVRSTVSLGADFLSRAEVAAKHEFRSLTPTPS